MPHTVYILYSEQLHRHYVGYTDDLLSRIQRHLTNHQGYTAHAKDWQLVYSEECFSKADALKLERKIKKRGAARFLDDL